MSRRSSWSCASAAIRTDDERLSVGIAIATIPAAIVGALGESKIDEKLGQPWQIAIFLAVFGVLLWFADRTPEDVQISDLGLWRSVLIGISQILALHARRVALRDHDHDRALLPALDATPPRASRSCC